MAPHGPPRLGDDGPFAGLRVLAALINDALAAMGTRPAFAGVMAAAAPATEPGAPTPNPPGVRRGRPAPGPRPAPRPGPGAGLGPSPDAGPDPGPAGRAAEHADGASDAADESVDESHVETWQLVRLAQGGDGEAFGKLYDRYVDLVFRFIYYRVNDRALAEDFTSETFLRALRRIGTFSYQGRDIGAWFVTIARNIVLDHMKSARHRLELPTSETLETREHAESTETAVLETLQSERLMQAVGQLGDEQRECVMLRFVHGLSVSETAQVMGKNDGAIKALQHRAVRKLADLVGGELR